jgi:hypothetical protein
MPHTDPTLVDIWNSRLKGTESRSSRLTVGLCWGGNLKHIDGTFRFAPLTAFAPLAGLRGVRFVSLQMGAQASELLFPPIGLHIDHLLDHSCSIADTAALMENLDVIVTVDTMAAHLAGALGRPVWVLLPYVADWRWAENRGHSPLYPSMSLLRQRAPGNWHELLTRVHAGLAGRVAPSGTALFQMGR